MRYVAIINVPGYLPMNDELPVFSSPGEAWGYLADERRWSEDACSEEEGYSETVTRLDNYSYSQHGVDVVWGPTPGYDSGHDLGLAYVVNTEESLWTESEAS